MDPQQLADYGLAGIVITGLFFALKNVFTIGMEKIDAMMERCAEEAKALRDEHRLERDDWRKSEERRHDKTDVTITKLTEVIEAGNNRHRTGD